MSEKALDIASESGALIGASVGTAVVSAGAANVSAAAASAAYAASFAPVYTSLGFVQVTAPAAWALAVTNPIGIAVLVGGGAALGAAALCKGIKNLFDL